MSSTPLSHRLATYGTLAPGRSNHHHVAELRGRWSLGYVRGHLSQDGWGRTHGHGYPAFVPDPGGEQVEVHVLDSADLPANWDRLDDFEGEGYARIPISVHTPDGQVEAFIYRHLEDSSQQTES
ncbi:gamma-glutamylcyclotransferase [Brachybacterium avium]|uniref:Gamma-glutamylcyclotransferase n=1 Tax=Brachybacterium avium TaxID=2017485 RepID=A0A220UC53_9MICO|nr:gamma-glutamylcyclotransferase family protein [Brachybacterium avium]ASK65600.1 gamma-glutamylcyclotransferase [Brachybacterium avium]